ncbi:hypothetical protein AB7V66_21885 [Providencia rettgeri]
MHWSVTLGGLCHKHDVWRPVFFKKRALNDTGVRQLPLCYCFAEFARHRLLAYPQLPGMVSVSGIAISATVENSLYKESQQRIQILL